MRVTRLVLGFALLATLGIGWIQPIPSHRSQESTAVHTAQPIQVADGTESNGGKGDKPKKRHMSYVA
jgi:hypothetical protein